MSRSRVGEFEGLLYLEKHHSAWELPALRVISGWAWLRVFLFGILGAMKNSKQPISKLKAALYGLTTTFFSLGWIFTRIYSFVSKLPSQSCSGIYCCLRIEDLLIAFTVIVWGCS